MKKNEVALFIEAMEELGDIWDPEDVKRVYSKKTLEEAIKSRKNELWMFGSIIGKVLNR